MNGMDKVAVGVVHHAAFHREPREKGLFGEGLVRLAADDFWDAVEIGYRPELWDGPLVRDLLAAAGVAPVLSPHPPPDYHALEAGAREAGRAEVRRMIDAACEAGARLVYLIPGPLVEEERREESRDLLVEALVGFCRYARRRAGDYVLQVSMEYFAPHLVPRLVGTTAEAVGVARAVRAEVDNFCLTVDQSHLAQLEEAPHEALPLAMPYLGHVHLANCVLGDPAHERYGDSHVHFGFPGGEADVAETAEFLRVLGEVGYLDNPQAYGKPLISLEVKPYGPEGIWAAVAGMKRHFRRAWALKGNGG